MNLIVCVKLDDDEGDILTDEMIEKVNEMLKNGDYELQF